MARVALRLIHRSAPVPPTGSRLRWISCQYREVRSQGMSRVRSIKTAKRPKLWSLRKPLRKMGALQKRNLKTNIGPPTRSLIWIFWTSNLYRKKGCKVRIPKLSLRGSQWPPRIWAINKALPRKSRVKTFKSPRTKILKLSTIFLLTITATRKIRLKNRAKALFTRLKQI